MKLIDTHAHLDHLKDLQQALQDAGHQGVDEIITVSEDLASCRANLEIYKAQGIPRIYLAMGIHPSEANLGELDACIEFIKQESKHLVAIGEIGLDFWYKWARKDEAKKDEQRKVFRSLLEIAKDMDLPAIIHTRGAWQECLEIVKEMDVKRAEFHWYSGPVDVLKGILDNGYYISASPSLAYSPQSREAVSYAPIERVMIETDSPVFYKTADDRERFQASPKDVYKTLDAYCGLMNVESAYAAEVFNKNAKDFFKL